MDEREQERGKVWLVGAGPGAFELITLRGADVLRRAQVVIYDYLVNDQLLELAPACADLIYAGKKGGGNYALTQEDINHLMIEHARAGKRVVRLKGGDPSVFGRGGEEMAALAAAGIELEVVPGVTAATAAPAFAGIPLTHREYGSFVTFVTGHEGHAKRAGSALPWRELARASAQGGTLVLLMAAARIGELMAGLIEHGMSAQMPAAAIQSATTAAQKTVIATLATLERAAREAGLEPPVVVVVGECARLGAELRWFERKPLFGRRIVITRARGQAIGLARELSEMGAQVMHVAAIETAEPDSYATLDSALMRLREFDWVIFTSAVGVDCFIKRLAHLNRDIRELSKARIAAIGPATAARVRACGLTVAVTPPQYRSDALVNALGDAQIRGTRVLLPRAQVGSRALPELLLAHGAEAVEDAPAYKTVKPAGPRAKRTTDAIKAGAFDLVTFTSPSTAINFYEMLNPLAPGIKAAAIGPVTAAACRELGFEVVAEAREHTISGLIQAVYEYFSSSS
jgi:uroporphyrinogen III methyltransferase/synthase